jgi:tetraacyldisaccharide 4'-kinase
MEQKSISGYLYNLALDNSHGFFATLVKCILFIASFFYGLIVRILIWFHSLKKPSSLNCKVISVGNITWGGTGKTVLVEFIARYLKQKEHKIAILSRGYKKPVTRYPLPVTRCETMADEPYMLSQKLSDVPIIADADRIRAAKKAIIEHAVDTVILDDGFQQWRIKKDLEIVVIDANCPFGNRHMIPRGILREPLSCLSRADIFVLTKTNLAANTSEVKDFLRKINLKAIILESIHKPVGFYRIDSPKELLSLDILKGKTATLFSGIGDPGSFESLIKSLRVNVGLSFRFPDHHQYSSKDLDNIFKDSQNKHSDIMITTEKDAVRIYRLPITHYPLPIFVLRIEIIITKDEERFYNRLLRLYSI